jgi:DNA-binding protein YbaB
VERSTTELTGRLAEYARLAESVKSVQDGIGEIRGTGYSTDGLVTAVVGGRGNLVELELDPRIYRERNATKLAEDILTAVHEAAAEAEQEATKIAEKLLPPKGSGDDEVDPRFDPALHMLADTKSLEVRQ